MKVRNSIRSLKNQPGSQVVRRRGGAEAASTSSTRRTPASRPAKADTPQLRRPREKAQLFWHSNRQPADVAVSPRRETARRTTARNRRSA